jgi:hypothetical protein
MGENPKAAAALPATSGPALEPPRPGRARAFDPAAAEAAVATDAPADAEDRLEAAFEASTRAEASLSALMRAVEQVTSGVSGAQAANEHLAAELSRARELLGSTNEQRLALRNKLAGLEQALAQARSDAEHDKNFLIEEQDRFLAALLGEHEEEIAELRRQLHEAQSATGQPPPAEKKTLPGVPKVSEPLEVNLALMRDELDRLKSERERSREILRRVQTQRDEAQGQVAILLRERDEAKAEILRLGALLEAPPELTAELRGEDARRLHPTPGPMRGRRTDPQPWRATPEFGTDLSQRATTPPPPEAQEALSASRLSTPHLPLIEPDPSPDELFAEPLVPGATVEEPSSRPPPLALLRKQDPTQRPLGGYSLHPEEIDTDRIDALPRSSKPPRP